MDPSLEGRQVCNEPPRSTGRPPVLDHYDLIKKGDTWVFEKRGSYRPLLTEATQADALKKMEQYMRTRNGCVRIYGETGEVEEEWTY